MYFTCNKCGESLKKKEVPKHLRCGAPFLTCVDCLKDFREDYVKHISCVSEKDRYSSQGLNGLVQKPKTKQELWVETVRECCQRAADGVIPGLTPQICDLFEYVQGMPGIPDKPKQFTNFVINSRNREPQNNISFVWDILSKARDDLRARMEAERLAAEAEKKKQREEKMKNQKPDSSDSSSSSDSEDDKESKASKNGLKENEEPKQEAAFEVVQTRRDKKKKRMVSESESIINGTAEVRQVKKSKKNPDTEESEDSSNLKKALDACHLNGVVEEEKLGKKDKRGKKKGEKYEAESKNVGNEKLVNETDPQDDPMEEVGEETEPKLELDSAHSDEAVKEVKLSKKERKEKKKREKYEAELKALESVENVDETESQDEPMEEVVEEPETKKGKKKKNRKNSEEIAPVDEEVCGTKDKKKEKKSKKQQRQDEAEQIYAEKPDKKGKTAEPESGKLNDTLRADEDNGAEFTWDTAILQVLESQSDHEISLKKLSKKVVNEYLLSLGDDGHVDEAKIINKFHKKLHKMHNVLVHKDKVRLKTSRD